MKSQPSIITAESATTAVRNRFKTSNWLQRGLFGLGVISGVVISTQNASPVESISAVAELPIAIGIAIADNKLAIRACERTLRDYRRTLQVRNPTDSRFIDRYTDRLIAAEVALPPIMATTGTTLGASEYTSSADKYVAGVYTFSGLFVAAGAAFVAAGNIQNNQLASHYEHSIATLANANANNVATLRPHTPPQ